MGPISEDLSATTPACIHSFFGGSACNFVRAIRTSLPPQAHVSEFPFPTVQFLPLIQVLVACSLLDFGHHTLFKPQTLYTLFNHFSSQFLFSELSYRLLLPITIFEFVKMRYSIAVAAFMAGAVTAVPALQNYGPAPVVSQITDGQVQVPNTVPAPAYTQPSSQAPEIPATTPAPEVPATTAAPEVPATTPAPSTIEETQYSTQTIVVTSCHPTVVSCPANSQHTTTTVVPIPKGPTTTPVVVPETSSTPVVIPGTTTPVVPETTTTPVAVPQTTTTTPVAVPETTTTPVSVPYTQPVPIPGTSVVSTSPAPVATSPAQSGVGNSPVGGSSAPSPAPTSPIQSGIGNSPIGASSASECTPVTVYSTVTVSPSAAPPAASVPGAPAGPQSGSGNSPVPATSPAVPYGSAPVVLPASSPAPVVPQSSVGNSPIPANSAPSAPYGTPVAPVPVASGSPVPVPVPSGTAPAGSSGG